MRKYALPLIAAAALAASISVPAAHADNLNVATAGPMTGEYAAFGEQMKRGAAMAVHDINAHGGVLGKSVALTVGDDACDPKQAVAVANDFVSKGIIFVAGHFCSGSSIPASSVYHDQGILQMTPAERKQYLHNRSGYRFPKCSYEYFQIGAWALLPEISANRYEENPRWPS